MCEGVAQAAALAWLGNWEAQEGADPAAARDFFQASLTIEPGQPDAGALAGDKAPSHAGGCRCPRLRRNLALQAHGGQQRGRPLASDSCKRVLQGPGRPACWIIQNLAWTFTGMCAALPALARAGQLKLSSGVAVCSRSSGGAEEAAGGLRDGPRGLARRLGAGVRRQAVPGL